MKRFAATVLVLLALVGLSTAQTVWMPGPGGPGQVNTTSTYWRIYIYDQGGSNALAVAELKFFDGTGTQISTTGGTASASSTAFGTSVSSAFDGNASTFWATNNPTYVSPAWLQYQFSGNVTVASFSITARNDSNFSQAPGSFALQSSNDGSTWTTIGNYSFAWTSAGQAQTFTAAAYGLGTMYRIYITAAQSGGFVAIAEVVLKDSGGSALSLTNGAASASTVYTGTTQTGPAYAFDADSTTAWIANNSGVSSGSPEWLAFRFQGAPTVKSFDLTDRSGNPGQGPSNFSFQSSTDGGATWTTLQTFTATWSGTQTQTFTLP